MNLRNKIKILSVLFGGVLRILYTQEIFDGYTLITPKEEPYKTQLIDNDYNVINAWDHECKVASMGYLSTDSTLLYPCSFACFIAL